MKEYVGRGMYLKTINRELNKSIFLIILSKNLSKGTPYRIISLSLPKQLIPPFETISVDWAVFKKHN